MEQPELRFDLADKSATAPEGETATADTASVEPVAANTEPSFEAAMKELEEVVSGLQRSDLSLDQSMVLFQRGSYLVQLCRRRLDKAEQEVKVLLEEQNGQMSEPDFAPGAEGKV